MFRQALEDFFGAVRFFTRLPVPAWVGHSADGLNRSARYFPAVGLLIGLLAALSFQIAALWLPRTLAVLVSMACTVRLTGAFHEDGLADTCDGFGGGWTPEQTLEIMKDSRLGSYGAIGLILMLVGKFVALLELPVLWLPAVLIAGHAVSRACATTLLRTLDYVRADASSKSKPLATRLSGGGLLVAYGFALLALLPLLALEVAAVGAAIRGLLFAGLATWWCARLFRRRLGGYTGDCLGATQQVSELAFYLGLLATWNGN